MTTGYRMLSLGAWMGGPALLDLEGKGLEGAGFEVEALFAGGFEFGPALLLSPRAEGDDAGAFGPGVVFGGHSGEAVGVLGGEVVGFGAVLFHVVEFPLTLHAFGDEFPFTIADGAVAFVFPEDGGGAIEIVAGEDGFEGDAFDGGFVFGVDGSGEVEAGGHDVDEVGGLMDERAVGGGCWGGAGASNSYGDAFGPVGDEGGGDAAFVDPVFVFAEGGVGDVGPVFPVADFGFRWAGHDAVAAAEGVAVTGLGGDHVCLEGVLAHGGKGGFVGAFEGADEFATAEAFGAAAVVLEEEDESVVELLGFLEGLDDAADALVHVVDHGGVDFHVGRFPFLEFDLVPVANHRRGGPVVGEKTELLELGDAGVADGGVAVVVFAFVLGDVLGQGMHGPVGGGVGDVVEEGLVGVAFRVFADVADGVVGDGVGVVPGAVGLVVGIVLGGDEGVVAGEGVGVEEGTGAVDGAVEAVEASLAWPVVAVGFAVFGFGDGGDVPFAGHVGAVAGRLESLGDGEALGVEIAAVGGEAVVTGHMTDACLMRVEAGEEGASRRAAAAGVVELREAEAVAGELVEVGRVDFAAIASDVGEAHVIGHDEDDIGLLRSGDRSPEPGGQTEKREEDVANHGG